jgi:hypothetical protein
VHVTPLSWGRCKIFSLSSCSSFHSPSSSSLAKRIIKKILLKGALLKNILLKNTPLKNIFLLPKRND